jgi:hypothetical protein
MLRIPQTWIGLAACALLVLGCKPYKSSLLSNHPKPHKDAGAGDGSMPTPDGGGTAGTGGSDASMDGSPEACMPTAEACNRVDDDCDGKIDEDAVSACQAIILNADSDCVRVGTKSSCVLIKCQDMFEDCDGNPANGCEPFCACHDCTTTPETDAGGETDAG